MSDIEDEEYKSELEEEEEDEHLDSDEEEENEKKPRLLISTKEDKSLAEKVDSDAENVPDSDEEDDEDDENKVVDSDEEVEDENDVESVNEEEQNVPVPKKSSSSIVKPPVFVEEDEDSDEDMDEDDHYLQKFDAEINKNYLVDFHPECTSHNYEEIAALSVVTRDKYNNIIDDLHKTLPYLTKYEKSRIIGQRAKQINSGAKTFVKVPENMIDGYLIAEMELIQKRVPFIIRRPIFGGGSEYWSVKDLENIGF